MGRAGPALVAEQSHMATPRFCRQQPLRACILVGCRRQEFLPDTLSPALRTETETINTSVATAIARFARDRGYTPEACRLGLVAYPLGAVRMYLPERDVPEKIDAYVAAAFRSAVSLG